MIFFVFAENLNVDEKFKKPPLSGESISLNSKSKFPQSIIFIIAGGAAGGSLWGKSASDSEKKFRNNIMKQCLEKRGYTVFTAE